MEHRESEENDAEGQNDTGGKWTPPTKRRLIEPRAIKNREAKKRQDSTKNVTGFCEELRASDSLGANLGDVPSNLLQESGITGVRTRILKRGVNYHWCVLGHWERTEALGRGIRPVVSFEKPGSVRNAGSKVKHYISSRVLEIGHVNGLPAHAHDLCLIG
jgi:hypothetical protein